MSSQNTMNTHALDSTFYSNGTLIMIQTALQGVAPCSCICFVINNYPGNTSMLTALVVSDVVA